MDGVSMDHGVSGSATIPRRLASGFDEKIGEIMSAVGGPPQRRTSSIRLLGFAVSNR